jgi:hypothetical protein
MAWNRNFVYADAYADLLWEENIVRSPKNSVEVVQSAQLESSLLSIGDIKFDP